MKLNFNKYFQHLIVFILSSFIMMNILFFIILFLLPTASINHKQSEILNIENFKYSIFHLKNDNTTHLKNKVNNVLNNTLSNIIVNGIIVNGQNSIATLRNLKKITVVSVNDTYMGYKVKKISYNQVLLQKEDQQFSILFQTKKSFSKTEALKTTSYSKDIQVQKKEFRKYMTNRSLLFREIKIKVVQLNGLKAFKIVKIRDNSLFSKIGLKKNDIITKINNKKTTSIANILMLVSQFETISELKIEIQRNNSAMEINYALY